MGGIVDFIFGGGSSAPKADPRIGEAALQNAAIGREALAFARDQAAITNRWAEQDRSRDINVFRPIQDEMIREARSFDNQARRGIRRSAAGADVDRAAAQARGANQRALGRMGVDPRSGRAAGVRAEQAMRTTLGKAGAMTQQDRSVEGEAYARKANAVNMGSGLAVNPLSSLNSGTSAVQGGSQAAMEGQRDVMGAYQHADDMKVRAYQSNMAALGELAGAAGMYYGLK